MPLPTGRALLLIYFSALSFGELLRGVINGPANELARTAVQWKGERGIGEGGGDDDIGLPPFLANFEIEIGMEEKGRIHCRKFYAASSHFNRLHEARWREYRWHFLTNFVQRR